VKFVVLRLLSLVSLIVAGNALALSNWKLAALAGLLAIMFQLEIIWQHCYDQRQAGPEGTE
jgi:hypothetical protein